MKKTSLKIIIISLIMCLVFCGYSTADNTQSTTGTCKITLNTQTSTYNPGDEIEILVKISDINTSGNGVDSFKGFLHFDNRAFEFLTYNGYDKRNNSDIDWLVDSTMDDDEIANEDNSGVLLMAYRIDGSDDTRSGPTKSNGNIMRIYLQVKDSAPNGNYEISMENIELDGENETTHEITDYLVVNKAKKDITIGTPTPTPANNTVNNTTTNNVVVNNTTVNNIVTNNTVTNNVVNNTVVNNTVKNNTVNNTNVNNNVINSIIPYVGMNTPIFGLGIVVMIIAAGTAIYKYNKYKSLK